MKYPANGHIILSTPGPLALEVNRYGYKIFIILWDLKNRFGKIEAVMDIGCVGYTCKLWFKYTSTSLAIKYHIKGIFLIKNNYNI